METWQSILSVRQLCLQPQDAPEVYIEFANMARKAGRLGFASNLLESLLRPAESTNGAEVRGIQLSKRP